MTGMLAFFLLSLKHLSLPIDSVTKRHPVAGTIVDACKGESTYKKKAKKDRELFLFGAVN